MYSDEFGRAPKKFGSSNYADEGSSLPFISRRARPAAASRQRIARCTVNFEKRAAEQRSSRIVLSGLSFLLSSLRFARCEFSRSRSAPRAFLARRKLACLHSSFPCLQKEHAAKINRNVPRGGRMRVSSGTARDTARVCRRGRPPLDEGLAVRKIRAESLEYARVYLIARGNLMSRTKCT